MPDQLSHKARYDLYKNDEVIRKSEQYAVWTLASLMADPVRSAGGAPAPLERDFQEMGALLTNNLASKLATLLFPSSRPFFRTTLSPELEAQSVSAGHTKTEIASSLARLEMDACQQIFLNASYNQLVMALKHLIVTGNVLLYRDSVAKKTTAYGLQHFTVRRDGRGRLMDCVLREFTYFSALDPQLQEQLRRADPGKYNPVTINRPESVEVVLYTRILRKATRKGVVGYTVSQEAETTPVGKPGYYPEHLCPWQAPTWNLIAGEHYARGLVEDYAGGFAKLSDMSHALVLYQIESTKVLNLVAPGSGADIDEMANAATGQWVTGDPATVKTYETGSTDKSKAVQDGIDQTFMRLSRAFMYTGQARDSERTTAFEIRQQALEAENTLGGVYSSLAEGLQVPLAHVLMVEVNPGVLAGVVTKDVKLDVMAGIPALGRSTDVQNLLSAAEEVAAAGQILPQLDRRIDPAKLFDLIYSGRSVDTSVLFKSKEQMEAEDEAQQQQSEGMAQMQNAEVMAQQQKSLDSLKV